MLSSRLVRLIEDNSADLAAGLVDRLRHSSRTASYLLVPEDELRRDTTRVYQNLGDWLMTKTETDIEYRYTQVGIQRAEQGVALSDFIWALIISKEVLWRFLQTNALIERVMELQGELEFLRLVDQFYDRAVYYGSLGYARTHGGTRKAA